MPDITIDVSVSCDRCGETLEVESKEGHYGAKEFHVEPCEKCLDVAKEEGDDEGHARGLEDEEVD